MMATHNRPIEKNLHNLYYNFILAHLLHIKKKNIIYKRNYLKQLNILSPWVFLGFSLYQYITMHYSHYKHFLIDMC
jgi:hypothetical protein